MRTNRDRSYKSLQTGHSSRPEMSPLVGPFHMVMQLFALAKLTPPTHLSSPHPKSLTLLSIPTMLEHHIPHMSPGRCLLNKHIPCNVVYNVQLHLTLAKRAIHCMCGEWKRSDLHKLCDTIAYTACVTHNCTDSSCDTQLRT